VPTVAGALATALQRAARTAEPPVLVCAGRTDAGVHASGQVVHVDLPEDYDGDLARVVNRQLSPQIVVRRAAPAPEGFDARRAATWRRYRYLVLSSVTPDPLLSGVAWHVPNLLDVRAMAAAADPLIGEHDFRAFCRRPPGTDPSAPIVRRVTSAEWHEVRDGWTREDWALEAGGGWPQPGGGWPPPGGGWPPPGSERPGSEPPPGTEPPPGGGWPPRLLRFDVVATSFCHQMVRSIVALLVDAGRGRATAAAVIGFLASGSRSGAPQPAPAHGLCLVGVGYGGPPGGVPGQVPGGVPVQAPGGVPGPGGRPPGGLPGTPADH
jgi:tRNA pseudouridine38-40 synthase